MDELTTRMMETKMAGIRSVTYVSIRHRELTHALGPKANELGLVRSPRSGEHGIQSINHSLDDTESGDAGCHEGQRSCC